jgi:hypothetical protein
MMIMVAVFLFGVLVGNWMMLLAIWWVQNVLGKVGASGLEDPRAGSELVSQIIYIPPDEDSDVD